MTLLQKIKGRAAKVGVIGLGYVGLPLVIEFVKAGYSVTGFDVDSKKVESLKKGRSYIRHIDITSLVHGSSSITHSKGHNPSKPLHRASRVSGNKIASGASTHQRFNASTDFSLLREMDCIIICVPTPLNKNREPDMTYVFNTTKTIAEYLRKDQLIILESTTYPGTTDGDMRAILEKKGLRAGKDFCLAFSPEREDPNNKDFSLRTTPKVVGGYTKKCLACAKALYDTIVERTVPVSSTRVAESAKLLENIYRAINIALVNELKVAFDKMGIDVWEVIEAAKTKPFGFQPFYPGPGLGGHCIAGNEIVWVKNCTSSSVKPLEELFAMIKETEGVEETGDKEIIQPKELFINSINTLDKEQSWKKITHLFKRPYKGGLITITTRDNRMVTVTDQHPMLRVVDGAIEIVKAKDLRQGDVLPIYSPTGCARDISQKTFQIDLVNELDEAWNTRVRVRCKNLHWEQYKEVVYSLEKSDRKYDWIKDNIVPLGFFKKLEKECSPGIDHQDLILFTGKGPAVSGFPAVVEIDRLWARFIGYYLSEGCATRERNMHRIRITINREEDELFKDLGNILSEKQITFSTSLSPHWKTRSIRVNSPLLGWLITEKLQCGTNSYTMKIPDEFLLLNQEIKLELLKGLFRGDGDVHLRLGMKTYEKNGRQDTHHDNSLTVGYFTSSNILFHQVLYLLQEQGIHPAIKRGKQRLLINGHDQVQRCADWFVDDKKKKIEKYAVNIIKKIHKRCYSPIPAAVVKDIKTEYREMPVYSVEVADNHTFAIAQGIYVHNCIPIDPFYLTWKAREYDVATRFIELAGEINTAMPDYVVAKVVKALNDSGKPIKGARVLMLGIAYKANVDDDRESPSYRLMEKLEHLGAKVSYNDPYIPVIRPSREFARYAGRKSVPVKKGYDLILIATPHDEYRKIDFRSFGVPVVDTRNIVQKKFRLLYRA